MPTIKEMLKTVRYQVRWQFDLGQRNTGNSIKMIEYERIDEMIAYGSKNNGIYINLIE